MNVPEKARRLSEVAKAVDLAPLESGDPRYVDIAEGRGGPDELEQLRICLREYSAADNRFAKVAFTGHRGSGKSTELLRLEHELKVSGRFTPLRYYVEEALINDLDYTDLFLWLTDELVRKFADERMPLNASLAGDVARWFAEVTLEQTEQVKSEIGMEFGGGAEAKAGWFGTGLNVFAKLKSMVVGSVDRRKVIRRNLQSNSADLIQGFNLLLDNARKTLSDHGQPPDLLIVVDNLDRVPPKVSETLFFQNGDLLKQPRAHFIYTVPVAIAMAPDNLGLVFDNVFPLTMIKVRDAKGKSVKLGLDALVRAVGKRVDIDAIFDKPTVVRRLAEWSGGSVRDLMRLVQGAQRAARAKHLEKIDLVSAKLALKRIRLDFERLLIPSWVYYPLLAKVHLTKADPPSTFRNADVAKVQYDREFFRHLLFNGSALEYGNDRVWYDVHPVIQEIEAFKKALADAETAAEIQEGGDQA